MCLSLRQPSTVKEAQPVNRALPVKNVRRPLFTTVWNFCNCKSYLVAVAVFLFCVIVSLFYSIFKYLKMARTQPIAINIFFLLLE